MIHFILSPKGGVGKSFFTMTLINFFSDKVHLIETDISNPDVYKTAISENKIKLLSTELIDISSMSGIGDLANYLTSKKIDGEIIINGRASNDEILNNYFEMIDEISKISGQNILIWWVLSDQKDGVLQLKSFININSQKVNVVLNRFFGEGKIEKFDFTHSKTKQEILEKGGKIIEMHAIPPATSKILYSDRKLISEVQKTGLIGDRIILNHYMRKMKEQLLTMIGVK